MNSAIIDLEKKKMLYCASLADGMVYAARHAERQCMEMDNENET